MLNRYRNPVNEFLSRTGYLFVLRNGAEGLFFRSEIPKHDDLKNKVLVIIKVIEKKQIEDINKEIVFLELGRPLLDMLYNVCSVSNPPLTPCRRFTCPS